VIAIISSKSPIFFKVTDDLETFIRGRSHAFHFWGTVEWNCWIGGAGEGGGFPVILIGMRGVFNSGGVRREGEGGNMIFRLKWIEGER